MTADAAAESWAKQFQKKSVSEDVAVVRVAGNAEGLIDTDGAIKLAKLLQLAGLAASAGEARPTARAKAGKDSLMEPRNMTTSDS